MHLPTGITARLRLLLAAVVRSTVVLAVLVGVSEIHEEKSAVHTLTAQEANLINGPAAVISSFAVPVSLSERQLLGLGIIALTLIVTLLMVWKLPMRRGPKGEEWRISAGYPNHHEDLLKPSLEGNLDAYGDNPSSNGPRSERVSVGAGPGVAQTALDFPPHPHEDLALLRLGGGRAMTTSQGHKPSEAILSVSERGTLKVRAQYLDIITLLMFLVGTLAAGGLVAVLIFTLRGKRR
jgi:hypothetical protein